METPSELVQKCSALLTEAGAQRHAQEFKDGCTKAGLLNFEHPNDEKSQILLCLTQQSKVFEMQLGGVETKESVDLFEPHCVEAGLQYHYTNGTHKCLSLRGISDPDRVLSETTSVLTRRFLESDAPNMIDAQQVREVLNCFHDRTTQYMSSLPRDADSRVQDAPPRFEALVSMSSANQGLKARGRPLTNVSTHHDAIHGTGGIYHSCVHRSA